MSGEEKVAENPVDDGLPAELDIRIGNLAFAGKGPPAWLAAQLQTVVSAIPSMAAGELEAEAEKSAAPPPKFTASLASHIKSKGAEKNQTLRFLVTADWLRLRGMETLTTAAVSKALVDNHQSRLANAADCLNKNVAKGFCEKVSGGFDITAEGLKELGHP